MRHEHEIHVVGAGLAGLAAAATATRAGHRVVLHERAGTPGGNARTDDVDGFRFNRGPHALYTGGAGSAVLRRLGVEPTGARPPTRGGLVSRHGRLSLAPAGPWSLLRTTLLGARDKVAAGALLAGLPRLDPNRLHATTVEDWLAQAAPRPAVAELVRALVRLTTYVDEPDRLSAGAAVGQLQLALGPGVRYLDHGFAQLVDALAATGRLQVSTGDAIRELPDAAAVVVAVGGPDAASSLVGRRYDEGAPATVSVLDLGLAAPSPVGFVLGVDEPHYLSEHGVAAGVAPAGRSTVTLATYLGRDRQPDRSALETFARRAGIGEDLVVTSRFLHRMAATTAIPDAARGGLPGRPGVAVPDTPGIFVAGDWVGPAGMLADAALASGEAAARAAIDHLTRRPVGR